MKKGLLILLCLPMIGFGQKTYIPCDTFEAELISLGCDTILDDSVYTNSKNSIISLQLTLDCNNLTGIEDFDSLINLSVFGDVKNIDLSNNYDAKLY